ncbi:uncharacterized protein LOC135381006 [Ornithodoros turicata]|uniref:uncharacterized protein LOC135381006 n=1 Tax=Ornithodoros turicata TaxID=34597 RepID=UPI003138870E
MQPLTDLLRACKSASALLEWSEEAERAFCAAKESLANATLLVHLDLVGPLPISQGNRYLFTCVDRFTRWAEVVPIPDATADTVGRAFLFGWVARFGCPGIVTTDRGRQFTSRSFGALLSAIGAKHSKTTAYHPSANGMVERLHRQLKAAICARRNSANWVDHLPWVLLGIRSSLKQDLQCSPSDLVFGCPLSLPDDFLSSPSPAPPSAHDFAAQLRDHFRDLQPASPRQPTNRKIFVHPDLKTSSHVFVRADHVKPPLTPAYTGPHRLLAQDEKTVTVDINGRPEVLTKDRVKPAYFDALLSPVHLPESPPLCPVPRSLPSSRKVSWHSPLVTYQFSIFAA